MRDDLLHEAIEDSKLMHQNQQLILKAIAESLHQENSKQTHEKIQSKTSELEYRQLLSSEGIDLL